MKTTVFLFVRREHGYRLVSGGVAVIAKPEDGIYVTVTCENEIPPPTEETLSVEQMSNWLKTLLATQCSMRAVDGYGRPLGIDPDGDR